jgi:predicted AAA+ superfamily ATPase
MEYKKRLIDTFVTKQLASAGAVLIRGPKGCGKTEMARHFAKSEVRIDESVMVKNAMESDPSLAVAALGLNSKKLLNDLEYFGNVFESLVIRDLRIYAQTIGAKIYEYRDSNGVEADAIIEMRDGSWAAFEIKLGFGAANTGIASLQKVAQTIDQEQMGAPFSLIVITAAGYAFRDKTGVNVVPLAVLRA